jgi:chaperonin cofactor prefoldin
MKEQLQNFANRYMGATFETTATSKKKLETELKSAEGALLSADYGNDRGGFAKGGGDSPDHKSVSYWQNEITRIKTKIADLETRLNKN